MKRANCIVPVSAESGSTSISTAGIAFTILGQCYSLKNSHIWGRGRSIKNPKASRFERDFLLQVPQGAKRALGSKSKHIRGIVDVWYPSLRQDVDVEIVWDLLQKSGVIRNDRYIRQKYVRGFVDKKNPRVEIRLELI